MTSNYCNTFKVLQTNITRYYSSTVQQPPPPLAWCNSRYWQSIAKAIAKILNDCNTFKVLQ